MSVYLQKELAVVGGDHGKMTVGAERLCTYDCTSGCQVLAASDGYLEICTYCCEDDLCNNGDTITIELLVFFVTSLLGVL